MRTFEPLSTKPSDTPTAKSGSKPQLSVSGWTSIDQSRTVHKLAQRHHDRPIRRIQLRPLDLTSHNAKLVPEKKQFRFRVVDSQPHINQIEEQPK
jgi:hypothetical protein